MSSRNRSKKSAHGHLITAILYGLSILTVLGFFIQQWFGLA